MASPSYGIDVVALAFAVVLATTVVLLASQLMPDLERGHARARAALDR